MIEWNEKMRSVRYSSHILFTVFRQIYVWNEGINTNDVNITEMNFKQVRGRDPRNILVGLLNLNNLSRQGPCPQTKSTPQKGFSLDEHKLAENVVIEQL